MSEKSGDLAKYLFFEGTNYQTYDYLGVHRAENGFCFRVWAPNAQQVFLCGDFNGWGDSCPMENTDGVWEYTLAADRFGIGSRYKYRIRRGGRDIFKADPYGFFANARPLPLLFTLILKDLSGGTQRGWNAGVPAGLISMRGL